MCVCVSLLSVSMHACEPLLHSVHFCTRWLITHRVCSVVEGGRGEWRGMSTFLVYDKVTENHWGVKYPPPTLHCPEKLLQQYRRCLVWEASPLMRPLKGPSPRQ